MSSRTHHDVTSSSSSRMEFLLKSKKWEQQNDQGSVGRLRARGEDKNSAEIWWVRSSRVLQALVSGNCSCRWRRQEVAPGAGSRGRGSELSESFKGVRSGGTQTVCLVIKGNVLLTAKRCWDQPNCHLGSSSLQGCSR